MVGSERKPLSDVLTTKPLKSLGKEQGQRKKKGKVYPLRQLGTNTVSMHIAEVIFYLSSILE